MNPGVQVTQKENVNLLLITRLDITDAPTPIADLKLQLNWRHPQEPLPQLSKWLDEGWYEHCVNITTKLIHGNRCLRNPHQASSTKPVYWPSTTPHQDRKWVFWIHATFLVSLELMFLSASHSTLNYSVGLWAGHCYTPARAVASILYQLPQSIIQPASIPRYGKQDHHPSAHTGSGESISDPFIPSAPSNLAIGAASPASQYDESSILFSSHQAVYPLATACVHSSRYNADFGSKTAWTTSFSMTVSLRSTFGQFLAAITGFSGTEITVALTVVWTRKTSTTTLTLTSTTTEVACVTPPSYNMSKREVLCSPSYHYLRHTAQFVESICHLINRFWFWGRM